MKRRFLLLAVWMLQAPWAAQAQTVSVEGQKFETTLELGGQRLVLNGTGLRTRAFFKVYAIGLYVATKDTSAEGLINQAGAKRVSMRMLRDLDGKDMGKTFTQAMEKNLRPEERAKSISGIFQYGQNFGEIKKLAPGDVVNTDWIPGTGTVVTVNGKTVGKPIPEPEFYRGLMRVWLGESPVDDKLKASLLGGAAS